ncbi:unnamed protein product [Paramecium primaurelia]|uniref:Uncharacterized protein n=1 Tax=Paramecium primaurelia TaxID=5886 RepID=A0A8S1L4Z4_PARPR|nr:unnamed protein product [Paramecium primaurelia]
MQNFKLPHSKLFWYIQEMYQQNLIDDHEKQQLKGTKPINLKKKSNY